MTKRKNTPEWTKTGVVWETKVLVWDRMAKGDSDTQIGDWLDRQKAPINDETLHLDRDTIALVRKELEKLPEWLAKGLPENIYGHWQSLQKQDEKPSPVSNTQLLLNKTPEKSNTGPTTQDNTTSESLQIKDGHVEQDKKPSADINAQPSPTNTEEIKHELLPSEDAIIEPNTQANDTEPSETVSKERVTPSPEEKSLTCLAPPDDINVLILKSWGVPAKKAGDILNRWCELHRKGTHRMCLAYRTLEDNLKNQKMPFRQAELYLNAELFAREFGIDEAIADFERSRRFRIWERPEYREAYLKDTRDLMKPMFEARQKHLRDVENLLRELREAVPSALETKKYDSLLKMEENPLFESLQRHCYDVYDFYWDLKRNLETAQYLESDATTSEIDKTMDNSKGKELLKLQKGIITSIKQLRKAIDYTLKNKSYSKEWCSDCYHDATIETNS